MAGRAQVLREDADARRVDAVVVADQDSHGWSRRVEGTAGVGGGP
jgi:hypothetical protein